MTAWSDEDLAAECLNGNEEAWSALIDKYKNLIFSIPIKAGLSREDAGEVFQQVCLKLLSELPSIRDYRCLGAWLIKVASYDSLHWSRRERARSHAPVGNADETVAELTYLPDEQLLQLEREQIFRETLLQLTPRCRDLIRMLFYETPSTPYDEVAKRLRLARGSIGFTRMRCLKKLRMLLNERGFH